MSLSFCISFIRITPKSPARRDEVRRVGASDAPEKGRGSASGAFLGYTAILSCLHVLYESSRCVLLKAFSIEKERKRILFTNLLIFHDFKKLHEQIMRSSCAKVFIKSARQLATVTDLRPGLRGCRWGESFANS